MNQRFENKVCLEVGAGSISNTSSITVIRHTGVNYASTVAEYAPHHVRENTILPGRLKPPVMVAIAA